MTSQKPDYQSWQQLLDLIETSVEREQFQSLLTMLLTPDERDALISRVNIINELLKGELSQRQISQMLGVGVATITRGSNELKSVDEETKRQLVELLSSSN